MALLAALAILVASPVADAGYDPDAAVMALAQKDEMVARVGYRLATANVARCARRLPATGLVLHGREQYGGDDARSVARLFSLGDAPGVIAVVPGSPAYEAGIRPGDAILAINGRSTPQPPIRGKRFDRLSATLDMMEAALSAGSAALDVGRGQARLSIQVTGAPACAVRFYVKGSSQLGATGDHRYVQIAAGLMDKFETEDELAAVVAHELAHNIMDHPAALKQRGVSRGFLGRFGRNARHIRETEIEADRFALLLMRDAGYRMAAFPEFWERFERRHGWGVFTDATHLNGRRRVDMLRAEIAAIEGR